MDKKELKHTNLTVKERNSITLNGVINVEEFDEGYVTLATTDGKINIEGECLKIESLSSEGGEIHISGKITALYYSEQKISKNIFAKLFG